MRDRRQVPGAMCDVERRVRNAIPRSLRAPGWLDKPGALRSLDVCLDSRGPFIDAGSAFTVVIVIPAVAEESDDPP